MIRIKTKSLKVTVLSLLFLVFSSLSLSPAIASPRIYVGNRELKPLVPPRMENGRTLIPLRTIFEALGATVLWFEDSQTIIATKHNRVIGLKIGSKVAGVNDTMIELDVPAKIVGGGYLCTA